MGVNSEDSLEQQFNMNSLILAAFFYGVTALHAAYPYNMGLPAGPFAAGFPYAGLPYNGLPAAGLSYPGLPTAGLPYAGLPYTGLPFGGYPYAGLQVLAAPAEAKAEE